MQQPDWLDKTEYPFASHYFALPEGNLHYLREGQGAPVVMVHGTPEWSFVYRHLLKALRMDYCCIAPDHLGFGLSDKPPHVDYAPERQAERLEGFLNHLNLEGMTLIVHDFGGPIGLAYAQKYPEKVKAIIVMNSWLWGLKQDPFYGYFSRFMHTALGKWLYLELAFSARFIMKTAFADKRKLSSAIHKHYLEVFPTPASRQATLTYAKSFIASDSWFEGLWQQRESLKTKPALLIWGMKDPAFKAKALARFETVFENYETKRLEYVGHFPQEEAAQEVTDLVKAFLAKG